MKEIEHITTFIVYDTVDELSSDDNSLLDTAIKMRDTAYAPYSNFNVGAAILLANNEIVTGNNQENAAYPSGMCAERVAVYSAGALYPGVPIIKIAISASSSNKIIDKPVGPCGSCRQAIAEYEFKQESPIQLLFMGEKGKIIKTNSLKDLLPLSFDKSFL